LQVKCGEYKKILVSIWGLIKFLPMTPSSSRTEASIKPGTVHEARSNTSAATASRRNPIARPNWGE